MLFRSVLRGRRAENPIGSCGLEAGHVEGATHGHHVLEFGLENGRAIFRLDYDRHPTRYSLLRGFPHASILPSKGADERNDRSPNDVDPESDPQWWDDAVDVDSEFRAELQDLRLTQMDEDLSVAGIGGQDLLQARHSPSIQ